MEIVRSVRYRLVLGLLALMGTLSIAAPARAQEPTLDAVRIVGDPVVGSPLVAVIGGSVDPAAVEFKWCRVGELAGKCAKGGRVGAGAAYVPVVADVGSQLMVAATATTDAFTVTVRSVPTAPVLATAPIPDPEPQPTPTETPAPAAPAPEATPAPAFASSGVVPGNATPAPPVAAPPPYLRPFPVVRIRGYMAARGARVTLLAVAAPAGVTVLVDCRGSSCPAARRRSRTPGRIHALERFLRAGTRITIRVTRPGSIGKYVRIRIRAGAAPARRDACLLPGSLRAAACPPA